MKNLSAFKNNYFENYEGHLTSVNSATDNYKFNDKGKVMIYARRDDFSAATIKSKNVLTLTAGLFFEERIKEAEIDYATMDSTTETKRPEMRQFPNPLTGTLNLEYSGTIDPFFNVEIFNVLDNSRMYKGTMTNALFSLDVSAWNSGFYSIVVTDSKGSIVYKSSTKIKN